MEGPRDSPVVSAGTNLTHYRPNNTANLNGSVTNALHAELHPHQGNNVLDEFVKYIVAQICCLTTERRAARSWDTRIRNRTFRADQR